MFNLSTRLLRLFGLLLFLASPAIFASDNVIILKDASQLPPGAIPAYEHILSFDSRARFNPDGSMEMQENIKVLALGKEIRRGIFRTLPLTWNRQDGKIFSVDYEIKSVSRDGEYELYSLDKGAKTLTLRIGSAQQTLRPGIYNYEIRYQISNHFSRFPEWDELYWNVTGNDWAWPITRASFRLELPGAADNLNVDSKDARLRSIDVYTGFAGAKEHNAEVLSDGSVRTLRPLAKGEGLTVVYTWPRAILAAAPAPEAASPLVHLLIPTLKTCMIWLPLLLMVLYYGLWWRKHVTKAGLRMPPVVPLFSLPAGMSPGYLRFLIRRKYDDIAFSSDLLGLVAKRGMAVKGDKNQSHSPWFSDSGEKQVLTRLPVEGNSRLNSDDLQLLSTLFKGKRKNIDLSVAHQKSMQNGRDRQNKRCEALRPKLFRKWAQPLRRCIYIALLMPVICGIWVNVEVALLTIPAVLFMLFGGTMLTFLLRFLCHPREMWRAWGAGLLFFAVIFGPLATLGGGLFLFGILPVTQLPAGYIGALLAAIVLCIFVGWKTPRYTQQGLDELAIAKGLKLYLGTAEKHRYQIIYPPAQMITHFEELLPVALALGVGKTWADTFAHYLSSTGAMSAAFASADWGSVSHFSESCRTSSMPTPGSSSGSGSSGSSYSGSGSSGGGSSGGGSGGGGGGGW
ncbi:TPA: DUF2207 domain-containing protein [Klebsiella michiganensis]|nr:DUF2207 domain-containing protein [Klebsiella michiganensis]HCB1846208.1 DUF2207 domain-containing protein [Klebsiella oxytoca]